MAKRWSIAGIILCIMASLLAACGNGSEPNAGTEPNEGTQGSAQAETEKVQVVLDWTPNTNHTGLYVAKDLGYFEEEGLDVEIILPGESGADAVVASGEVQFGVSYQESVTMARTQGVPLVSIAAVIQHNTSGFASLEKAGIQAPKDFEGKTYSGWGSPVEAAVIQSLMNVDGGDFSKVTMVNSGTGDFFTSMEQDIDFAWIYYAWTGVEAELRNQPINVVWLTDYSEKLDYYTPVIATNETLIKENPEMVKKFLKAVSKGYQYAIDNPEQAADILVKAVPELNKELVVASQKWLSPKYTDDAPRWGEQKRDVWANYAEWLTEHKLLEGEFNPDEAFTNEFLPE